MRILKYFLLAILFVSGIYTPAQAQFSLPDGLQFSIPYYARNNNARPGVMDNDIAQINAAYTYLPGRIGSGETGLRVELGFGGHEDLENPLFQASGLLFRQTDQSRYGVGLGLEWTDMDGAGALVAVTGEWFLRNWTLSGMAGYQTIDRGGLYGGTKNSAPFAHAGVRWYPWDWASGSLGVTYEEGDTLVNVGLEAWIPRSNFSGYLEFVFAPESFRGEPDYNSLTMGVRISNPFGSLKKRDRTYATYAFHRPVHLR
ncbi:MAG: hypothetical protein GY947_09270 [Rhodobacteraceae bacterium]|nr:hypothetical protein [Paracoccaceae bacterium]